MIPDSSESDSRGDEPSPDAAVNDSGGAEPGSSAAGDPHSTEDDVRRKFREALDKQSRRAAGSGGRAGGPADKFHGAHGPAATRRTFRRKSGG